MAGVAPSSSSPPGTPSGKPPKSVLFVCGMNAIRSPMAEALARHVLPTGIFVASAGVRAGDVVLGVNGERYLSHAHTAATLKHGRRPVELRLRHSD